MASKMIRLLLYYKYIGGGRVGPGRAMPDQEYGPEIINDVILVLIINNNQLIISKRQSSLLSFINKPSKRTKMMKISPD